jgi:hypothetical protein
VVTEEVFATIPDSGGDSEPTEILFTLSTEAREAIGAGAILEAVLHGLDLPWLWFDASAFVPSDSSWYEMPLQTSVSGDWHGNSEKWWQEPWLNPGLGARLVGSDGTIRMRISHRVWTERTWVRVLWLNDDSWLREQSRGLMANGAGRVAILEPSGILHQYDPVTWGDDPVQTSNVPLYDGRTLQLISMCRVGDHYYGANWEKIWRVPATGGEWEQVALMPEGEHLGIFIESDGRHLYVLRFPPSGLDFPILYRLNTQTLANTSRFKSAIVDWLILHRNDLEWGLFWNDASKQFASVSEVGGHRRLLTFDRSGHFSNAIQLPVTVGRAAFIDKWVFTWWGSPTLETVSWGLEAEPAKAPGQSWITRWRLPD